MTQLMLFDAPTNTTSSSSMADAAVDYARTVNRDPQTRAQRAVQAQAPQAQAPQAASAPASASSTGLSESHQAGVNHMGDLARLVLMRYDLLARRRAEIAARHAS